ncbi:YbhB/YbcL family Raf kinase inhibitor-like protein [Lactiplantibacillus daowaiensis]|uniref:YbhB/YbcL family Raf kinase inhibitor-like protein n=1 Tax=Lactiplantibacillus daowaiensis TaxID=2559918 RepID=A0ABW1RZE6_9LACO|nr:YbhB/YbcL family Raf kinase inhibitor-like protein [Lactiplantibacillus daowaiensis]
MQLAFPFTGPALPDAYGINQPADQLIDGLNLTSFPFTVTDLPTGTKTVAFDVIDHDTIPIVGYSWLHWLGANIPVTGPTVTIPEDASRQEFCVQGTNSIGNILAQIKRPIGFDYDLTQHYTGPRPRGGEHIYRLEVYALETMLPLTAGYYFSDFMRASEGHVLATAHANLTYTRK